MKYHYQYVTSTAVRIELIPEDKKEAQQISSLATSHPGHPQLSSFYQLALEHYSPELQLTKINFMNFPTVALCSFTKVPQRNIQDQLDPVDTL